MADLIGILRAVFALAIVLGLIVGLAYVLRRYAPNFLAKMAAQRGQKRLQVVETLILDPARRLVLVKLDDEERLILLGEGHELIEPRPHAAVKREAPIRDPRASEAQTRDVKPRPVLVKTATNDAPDDLF